MIFKRDFRAILSFTSLLVGLLLAPSLFAQVVDTTYTDYECSGETIIIGEEDEVKGWQQDYISPIDILRGRVAGVSISRRSFDPNEQINTLIRGITGLDGIQPLIVVDGYRVQSMDFINPLTVKSIRVLKDVASASKYGLLGAPGVIEIEMNQESLKGLSATYQAYMASSIKSNEVPVMSAEEYMSAGGNNLGTVTNWQDEVSRKAFTQVHNLSVVNNTQRIGFYASGTVREMEGILKKSGFGELSGRAGVKGAFIDDRLTVGFDAATSSRDISYSFIEANRYASVYNPTAPITFDNGNYFQAILFDNFNPVAIIEQNLNEGENDTKNVGVNGLFDIIDGLSLSASFNRNTLSGSTGEFYASDSFFRGLNYGGIIRRSFFNRDFSDFHLGVAYKTTSSLLDISTSAGIKFWSDQSEITSYSIEGLYSDDFGYHLPVQNSLETNMAIESEITPKKQNLSYYLNAGISNQWLDAELMLRLEEFNQLGIGGQTAFYPSFTSTFDINHFLESGVLSELKLKLAVGNNGVLPVKFGYANGEQEYSYTYNDFRYYVEPNDDLTLSEISETNIGLDIGVLNDLKFNLTYYKRTISDMILEMPISFSESVTGSYSQYQNAARFLTNGFEATIEYSRYLAMFTDWSSRLTFSSYKTKLEEYSVASSLSGHLGAPGFGSTRVIKIQEGQEVGIFWGPVFDYVDEDGIPIMKDLNGDGVINSDPGSALNENGDYTVLGKGTPDFELGWNNDFRYRNFGMDILLRGVFGHSLINTNRVHYEAIDLGAINSYNRTQTDKAVDGLTANLYSSLYVEKADFIRLEYLTFYYDFWFDGLDAIEKLTTYFTVQNLFTITNYTGVSPDPIYSDLGSVDNGGFIRQQADYLTPGIERRNKYLPSRTILFGIKLDL